MVSHMRGEGGVGCYCVMWRLDIVVIVFTGPHNIGLGLVERDSADIGDVGNVGGTAVH